MAANVKGQVPCTCILLDTSASMNQRTSSNISLLDMAKAAIEQMVEIFHSHDVGSRHDLFARRCEGFPTSGSTGSSWSQLDTFPCSVISYCPDEIGHGRRNSRSWMGRQPACVPAEGQGRGGCRSSIAQHRPGQERCGKRSLGSSVGSPLLFRPA